MLRLLALLICATLTAQQDPRLQELAESLAAQDFKQAEVLLTRLAGERPRNPALQEQLGLLLLRRGALSEAQQPLEAAIRLDPKAIGARLALARLHWLQGDGQAAEARITEAEQLGGEQPTVQRAIARYRSETGDGARARAALEKAIELAPDDARLPAELTQLYLDHRAPQGALTTAAAALERFPEDADLLRLKGLALYGLGESAEAIDALLASAHADPDSDLVYASLETLLPDAGDRLPAIVELLEGYSMDAPQSPVGPYLLALALATSDVREPRVGVMLREAVRRDPTFWPAWFELHRSLELSGDTKGAIEALEKAATLSPEYPGAQFALARLYAKAGRKGEAFAARQKHHELMTARRESEERRREEKPRLGVNE